MFSSSMPSTSSSSSSSAAAARNNSSCNRKVGRGRRKMATMKQNRSSSSSSSSSSLLVLLVSLFVCCCEYHYGTISHCDNNNNNNNNMFLFANALSSSSTSTTPTTKNLNRIEYFNPDDKDNNDQLLIAIQDCRRTSFPPEKKNFMDAERDFIAAKNVINKKKLCVIIFDDNDDDNENNNNIPRILGTADLQPQYNYINKQKQFIPKGIISNVFVRPDERGKKFGQQLMIDGIENILIKELFNKLEDDTGAIQDATTNGIKLTLDVYTQNKPALQLYLKLGYVPDGPVNDGVYKMSQLFNSNLFITLTKTIQV